MRVVGIRCTKDSLDWAVLEGSSRNDARVVEQRKVSAPTGDRGQQLAWIRREIAELLNQHAADQYALRVSESGGQSFSIGRAEVEGVVQERIASNQLACKRVVSATLRGAFNAKNGAQLAEYETQVPCVAGTAKTRREPVVAAAALLPA